MGKGEGEGEGDWFSFVGIGYIPKYIVLVVLVCGLMVEP